jgi:hypothetical protein
MPATPWTELTGSATGFQIGFPDAAQDASSDYFIDVLFEGSAFSGFTPTSYTELTGSAWPTTELTGTATPYTELTL